VARRFLAASKDAISTTHRSGRAMPLAAVFLVPVLAFGIYALRGAPQLPDVPRAERIAMAQQTGDVEALLVQVEDHLATHPDDVTGWKLLVPTYMSLGRYTDAAAAIGKILQLEKPTADHYAELAEALTFANQNLMTEAAEKAAGEALKLDARNPKALYYDALATSQKGLREEAARKFEFLLSLAPADAPWRSAVEGQIKSLSASAPALTDEQMKAAEGQTPEERLAMIRGMVEGLEARLAENGNDLEGWLRLIRARTVLNEQDRARGALSKARTAFANDAAAAAALDTLAKELNL
jgi:cytochrome c-type biogenesis protein CcmH